jgi:soluble lytic murein transglycosylase-like protein
LLARRSLIIVAVGILSLAVGTSAAAAASDALTQERERKQKLAALEGQSAGAGERGERERPRPEWASYTEANTIAGVPRDTLEAIASCESGGDPTAVSANGRYFGKYQFSRSTWRSVGGRGNPAAAAEAEQDRRARILYRRAGTSPWPNCAPAG